MAPEENTIKESSALFQRQIVLVFWDSTAITKDINIHLIISILELISPPWKTHNYKLKMLINYSYYLKSINKYDLN